MSYDQRQIDKPLKACLKCGRMYYMADVICAWCGEGFGTTQHKKPARFDVNGCEMNGP